MNNQRIATAELDAERQRRGLTEQDVATNAGVSLSDYRNIMRSTATSLKTLRQIAGALGYGVSIDRKLTKLSEPVVCSRPTSEPRERTRRRSAHLPRHLSNWEEVRNVSQVLRDRQKKLRLTQSQLAEATGLPPGVVRTALTGRIRRNREFADPFRPTYLAVAKLVEAMGGTIGITF